LVVVYLLAMPLLAGLPRGRYLPLVRPSEGIQLFGTGIAVTLAALALFNGRRWELRVQRHEWWLAAMAVAGSFMPVLWLVARSEPVTADELLAAFPLVKFAALYVLVRTCVTRGDQIRASMLALTAVATVLSVLAVAQALKLGPTAELLGRYFVSSVDDVADGGRATTTIGSSIATGAFLTLTLAVTFTRALVSGRYRWLVVTGVVGLGALASGQAGTVVALAVVIIVAVKAQGPSGRLPLRSLALLSVPVLAVAAVVLWPVVLDRLADVNSGTGLPTSWLVRWSNVSDLYLPSLLDWGWVLGVSPDAEQLPPDLWRTSVYLESGYLWMLWVGGLPLLVTAVGFLASAHRMTRHRPGDEGVTASTDDESDRDDEWLTTVRVAARAAVSMMIVLSLIDPHLTLRAGADLFFVLVASASAGSRLARPLPTVSAVWRKLIAADGDTGGRPSMALADPTGPRLYVGEAPGPDRRGVTTVRLEVVAEATVIARTELSMTLDGFRSDGRVGAVTAVDDHSFHLLMRAVALVAGSLRLDSLHLTEGVEGGLAFDRRQLRRAADLARRLERARASGGDRSVAHGRGRPASVRLDVRPKTPRWKRTTDVAVGAAAVVITAPLWLSAAVLVRRSSPGPVLFRQLRVGLGGLPFVVHKFRTMYVDNDDSAHRHQNRLEMAGRADGYKDGDDPRITPIGRWLRRLSLDELPQLGNVMRGEMSLVGPRPSLLWEVELFPAPTRRRLTVTPGITGVWQTSGRADLSLREMLEIDLRYVDERSPRVDLRCLVRTAGAVVGGEGAT